MVLLIAIFNFIGFEDSFFNFILAMCALVTLFVSILKYNQFETDKKKEQVEKTFYSMLEQHNNFPNQYKDFYNKVTTWYLDVISNPSITMADKLKNINEYNTINTYLRMLYQILKFLSGAEDKKIITHEEAKIYSNLLRSFISEQVLLVVAYNASRDDLNHIDNYRKLINKYNFLEHLNLHTIFNYSSKNALIEQIKMSHLNDIINNGLRNDVGECNIKNLLISAIIDKFDNYKESFGDNPDYPQIQLIVKDFNKDPCK